jgi:mevalonate kinase
MKRFKVSAPGKLHLLGEHVVVYNKPALLVAVDKRCFVETVSSENNIKVYSKNYKKELAHTKEEVLEKFEKAQKDWELYNENNDVDLLKSITKDPLDYPFIVIGQFLNFYKINKTDGLEITINSDVPVGCGMGSSGSLAVSLIGALSLFFDKPFDKKTINEIAFLAEQKKHGKPSGGDNSTSTFGGLVRFKKDEGIKPLNFSVSEEISKNFYIINTGTPSENTGEMVSLVRKLLEEKPLFAQEIFDKQEELVKDLYLALEKNIPRQIPGILEMGEMNLEKLGVVSDYVKGIIRDIEESGGAAKICGGGGTTKSTGIILIYHTDLQKLKKVLESHKLTPAQLSLGVEGLRQETA